MRGLWGPAWLRVQAPLVALCPFDFDSTLPTGFLLPREEQGTEAERRWCPAQVTGSAPRCLSY